MAKLPAPPVAPECSRPLAVDRVPPAGLEERIVATEEERQALARRFDLMQLTRLEAQLSIDRASLKECYDVTGTLTADVVQSCVVTLDPLPAHIEQDIRTLFAPVAAGTLDPEDTDAEAIVNGYIDLGELVAQYLGLSLDPYPRKPGLEFQSVEIGAADTGKPDNPFAKLIELKPKK